MNCKLVGNFVQHLEVLLSPGEDFYAEKGSLIYLESGIEKDLSFNGSGLGRLIGAKLSGESLFIIRLYNISNQPKKNSYWQPLWSSSCKNNRRNYDLS